jgi:DNA-binding MarR family transcriptional regulator
MTTRRLSRLQRRILSRLAAEYERTRGLISMSHFDLVQVLGSDKSTISHSLRTLEARGLIRVGCTPGRKADFVNLTPEGRKMTSEID